ncbi:hypothetical protein MNV49_002925 [Pseudohyphozyma bogoriensis]|nr:hypothetical protein MNV49_002925 [Pseudohyphozyma bogoriensis]
MSSTVGSDSTNPFSSPPPRLVSAASSSSTSPPPPFELSLKRQRVDSDDRYQRLRGRSSLDLLSPLSSSSSSSSVVRTGAEEGGVVGPAATGTLPRANGADQVSKKEHEAVQAKLRTANERIANLTRKVESLTKGAKNQTQSMYEMHNRSLQKDIKINELEKRIDELEEQHDKDAKQAAQHLNLLEGAGVELDVLDEMKSKVEHLEWKVVERERERDVAVGERDELKKENGELKKENGELKREMGVMRPVLKQAAFEVDLRVNVEGALLTINS